MASLISPPMETYHGEEAALVPWASVWTSVRGSDGGKSCGDSIGVRAIGRDRLTIVMTDVAGRGEGRSRLSAQVTESMLSRLAIGIPLRIAFQIIEIALRSELDANKVPFIVMFAAVVDSRGWTRYIAAGHETALVVSDRGGVRHLNATAPALGIVDDPRFTEAETVLEPDEHLVLVSDGVTDSRPEGRPASFFGVRGVVQTTRRALLSGDNPARAMVRESIQHGHGSRDDDRSAFVLSRNAGAKTA